MNFFLKLYVYFLIYLVTRKRVQKAINNLPEGNEFQVNYDKMVKTQINASRNAKWLTNLIMYCIQNGKVDQLVHDRTKAIRTSKKRNSKLKTRK